jgi:uncharacterized protein (TIGR00645 family)
LSDNRAERVLESVIFNSRWLMAPFYLGLVVALLLLMIKFIQELIYEIPLIFKQSDADVILFALTLIDMSLAGNLMLMVIFAGYENFVSKIESAHGNKDRPDWMGTVDFGGLKLKLIASIVAISGIHLLKYFMYIGKKPMNERELMWLVIIHITFVVSGVLLALMDRLVPAHAAGFTTVKDPHSGTERFTRRRLTEIMRDREEKPARPGGH